MTRQQQREATRQQVLAVAGELFDSRGFEGTTIRDIADAAEVSVGTVMAVGDKSALLVEVFDRRISRVHEQRASSAPRSAGPAGADIVGTLLGVFAPFVEMFADNPALAHDYAAALVSGRHRAGVFHDLAIALRQELAQALEEAGFTQGEAARRATALHLAYLGTLFMSAGTPDAADPGPANDFISVLQLVATERETR